MTTTKRSTTAGNRRFAAADSGTAASRASLTQQRRATRSAEDKAKAVVKARELVGIELDFIYADEFAAKNAEADFRKAVRDADEAAATAQARTPRRPAGLPSYLAGLYEVPLLKSDQESSYFRLMNFLKYQANQSRSKLNPARPNRRVMEHIESLTNEAEDFRNRLIRANLRLVVANARRFVTSEHGFDDLVSDGNLALMHAVAKFDYARGFRFSTYATHAIRRTYYRRLSRKQTEKSRILYSGSEILEEAQSPPDAAEIGKDQLSIYQNVMRQIESHLDDRELLIVRARYGLDNREDVPTLQTLATRLGICKERVRQLQNRALIKLQDMAQDLHSGWELPVVAG